MNLIRRVIVCSAHRRSKVAWASLSLLNHPFELRNFNSILVLHASQLTKLRVFEDGVSLTKEVVDQKGKLVPWSYVARFCSILINQSVDT